MTVKTVLKKLKLDECAFEKIRLSVKEAEQNTSGEIAVCLANESSDYSFWEFFASTVAGILVFFCALPFSSSLKKFYESENWLSPEWYIPLTFGVIYLLSVLIFFFLFNIPFFDRLVIPFSYKSRMVSKQAFSVFAQTGVYETEHHNGILIYVSYLERQVRIVCDKGISNKISDDLWKIIADSLASDIAKGNAQEAFCDEIGKCGELLKEHYPSEKENENELPDGLVILEN